VDVAGPHHLTEGTDRRTPRFSLEVQRTPVPLHMFNKHQTVVCNGTVPHALKHHPIRHLLALLNPPIFTLLLTLPRMALNIAKHIDRIGPFKEIEEGKLPHIIVVILPHRPQPFKNSLEAIHLLKHVDVRRMDVEDQLLRLVSIGIE
jgi:hypothetical protein